MKMMGHDDFIIHQRRAKFASDRHDFHRLPVEGSAAYSGKSNPLADLIGLIGMTLGFATLAYMLARIIFAGVVGHG